MIFKFCFFVVALSILADCRVLSQGKEEWGYVTVRPDAHMFWWLYNYEGSDDNVPLILWLQGGPGASGTGFGNFGEIGPLDIALNPRRTTWLNSASLLFIDNPVGSGYSYVTNPNAYTKTVDQIASDLVVLLENVFSNRSTLQKAPFYIFSESYGGKMAAVLGVHLWDAIQSGKIAANFQGVAMGDSWVHPEIIVKSWGPYLYFTSYVDQAGLETINDSALNISKAIAAGNWTYATELWDSSEDIVSSITGGVDWYNILNPIYTHARRLKQCRTAAKRSRKIKSQAIRKLYQRHVAPYQDDPLTALMNGPIREKLQIIPENVIWGGQSADVFSNQEEEFMKPVVSSGTTFPTPRITKYKKMYFTVDYLLANTTLKVVVYNGQLDLICDTIGVEAWVQTLKWAGLKKFNKAERDALNFLDSGDVFGYVKSYKNFYFYWMLRGGHMLPADQGQAALRMVDIIVDS